MSNLQSMPEGFASYHIQLINVEFRELRLETHLQWLIATLGLCLDNELKNTLCAGAAGTDHGGGDLECSLCIVHLIDSEERR